MKLYEIAIPDVDIAKLKELCAPYISVLKHTDGAPLFRGYKGSRFSNINGFQVMEPNLDRTPVDTPQVLHTALNQAFKRQFGFPYRNGVFASGSYEDARYYGEVYAVFPIGELKYIWSKQIGDLYVQLDRTFNFEEISASKQSLVTAITSVVNAYQNTELDKAILSGHEVMIANKCIMIKNYGMIKDAVMS
jgi:hypothetical protein